MNNPCAEYTYTGQAYKLLAGLIAEHEYGGGTFGDIVLDKQLYKMLKDEILMGASYAYTLGDDWCIQFHGYNLIPVTEADGLGTVFDKGVLDLKTKCYICNMPMNKQSQKFLKKHGGTGHKCMTSEEYHYPPSYSMNVPKFTVDPKKVDKTTVYIDPAWNNMQIVWTKDQVVSYYAHEIAKNPNMVIPAAYKAAIEKWQRRQHALCTQCFDKGAFFKEVHVGRLYESILTVCACKAKGQA